MSSVDTKERILNAAERLFGEHGFAGTSLRAITKEAGVNLAAIHYHFGSKEALLLAALDRYAAPVNQQRLQLLQEAEDAVGEDLPSVERILEIFVAPYFYHVVELGERRAMRARFIGRIYTEPDEAIQRLVRSQFRDLGEHFLSAFARALPEVPQQEIYWRMKFVLSVVATLLAESSDTDAFPGYRDLSDVEGTIRHVVAFCAPGLRAPVRPG